MNGYVMPPYTLEEFKRIFTVNRQLPPLPVLDPPNKEGLMNFDGIFKMFEQTPQSTIEEPEPHEDDERIQ